MAVTLNNSQLSAGLYSAFWNRAPDATGQNFWVGRLNAGDSVLSVATEFYNAPEGLAAYPNWIRNDPVALVTQAYQSVFERAPDPVGLAFYVNQIKGGTSFPQVIINMMTNAVSSAANGNTDGLQFLNEIQVGVYVSETLRTNDPAITSVALEGVTYEQSSVVIREAQLAEMVNPGVTYTLTTNADVATAEYFDGSLNSFGKQTLNNFDQLTGQKTDNLLEAQMLSGTFALDLGGVADAVHRLVGQGFDNWDVHTLFNYGAAVTTPQKLENIQNITVQAMTSSSNPLEIDTGVALDLRNADAVTSLTNEGSEADLSFGNVGGTLETVHVHNTGFDTYVNLAANANIAELDVHLSNAFGGARVDIDNVATLNVMSHEVASNVELAFNGATTINLAGDADLTAVLATETNTVTLVDATELVGDLDLTMSAQTGVLGTTVITINGGLGNDTIDTSAVAQDYIVTLGAGNDTVVDANLTASDTIVGGLGFDTVSTTFDVASTISSVNGVNGIDQLNLSTALNGSVTVGNVDSSITEIEITPATGNLTIAASTIVGAAGEFVVELGSDTNVNGFLADALTVTDTGVGVEDTVVFVNNAVDTGTNIDVFNGEDITVNGYENVVLVTGNDTNALGGQEINALTITADVAAAPVSVKAVGTNSLSINTLTTNSTGKTTVNASELQIRTNQNGLTIGTTAAGVAGTFDITGSNGVDTITVGNFASTIVGGTGNDVLTGGTAADNIRGDEGNDVLVGNGGNDTIFGGAGNDDITADDVGVISVNGGAGDDLVDVGVNLATADIVDGGEGTDRLELFSNVISAVAGVTNFEILDLEAPANVNLSNFGANAWEEVWIEGSAAPGANVYTVSGLTNSVTDIIVESAMVDSLTLSHATNSLVDVLAVNSTLGDVTITNLVADDTDTLTFQTAAGNASTDITVTTLDAADVDTIVITGNDAVSLTVDAVGGLGTAARTVTVNALAATDAVTFNGTAVTLQNLSITGSATAANVLTGGALSDVIQGGVAADLLTGGAGNDTINAGLGAVADTVNGGTGADSITLNVDGATDTVEFAATDSLASTSNTLSANIDEGDTITFTNNVDVVYNFLAGGVNGDILSDGDGAVLATALLGQSSAGPLAAATNYFLSGSYNAVSGVFTVAANGAGADTMIIDGNATTLAASQGVVVLVGVDSDALVAANFA